MYNVGDYEEFLVVHVHTSESEDLVTFLLMQVMLDACVQEMIYLYIVI